MRIYDTASDVVRKGLRGLELAPSQLAENAGIGRDELEKYLRGQPDEEVGRRIALALGLDAEALVRLPHHSPSEKLPPGVTRLELPFGEDTVNAWLLQKGGSALVIDAGSGPNDLARALDGRDVGDFHLLITHPHPDHIAGIRAVENRLLSMHAPTKIDGASVVAPGEAIELVPFSIRTFDLRGHHPDALGYAVAGFPMPVVAVGDAVFAGSIGGCAGKEAYANARRTIVAALEEAPPEIHLLTGHGQGTTLEEERVGNPFLAAWLKAD